MKQAYILICLVVFGAGMNSLRAQYGCAEGRYINGIFADTTTCCIPYGNAIEYTGDDTTLLLDLYQPQGDNFAHRPLIVWAFPGSFTSGARESPDIVILATYFAQHGYVCASIDYRIGIPVNTDSCQFLAVWRGVQDMMAAVRFFYKDAQTADLYRIDTNQIFIGGSSAGAFIALNYGYFKQDTFSKPPPSFAANDIIELGGIDGNSGNPGYSQNVKGVIDLSGGIADTVWIMPGDPLLVGEHGTDDSLVMCWYDSAYAVTHTTASLFGGGDIKNRLANIPNTDSMYLFYGAGHVPFILPKDSSLGAILAVPLYMDSTEWLIRDFLYQNIVCDTSTVGITGPSDNVSLMAYPNPSNKAITMYSQQTDDLDVTIVNEVGQLMRRDKLKGNSRLTLQKGDFGEGIYFVQFLRPGTNNVLRTEKIIFY